MPPSANDIVVRVIPDIQAAGGSISSQFKKVANPIKKIVGDAVEKGVRTGFSPKVLSDFKKSMDPVRKVVGDALASTLGAAFSSGASGKIQKKMVKMQQAVSDAHLKSALLEQQIQKATEKTRLREAKKRVDLEAKNLEDRLKKEAANVTAASERSKKALKALGGEVTKLSTESAEKFGESLAGAFSDITSGDMGNMAGLIKKIGEGTKKQGLNAQAKAGVGPMGKLMDTLGGFLSKIGPALIAIGALAGGLAAMAKIIMDVDEKAKELNKTMIESGISGMELSRVASDVEGSFSLIRKAFTDFNLNRIWGTNPEDHIKILGAYAEAGLEIREITNNAADAAEEMERLQQATIMTLKYSKLLGTGSDEMAGNIAMWMEELGQDIKTVEEGLSAVTVAARDSGFGVKRFYGMVLQATSGMSMYNVRLAETAAMLSMITKILGPQRGGAFVEGLTKGFSEEGYQDRMKRTKLVGAGNVKGELGGAAGRMGGSLLQGLKDGQVLGLQEAAKAAGMDVDLVGKSTEDQTKALVAALTTAGPKKTADFIALAEEEIGLDQTRKLEDLAKLSAGIKGGLADVAHAMSGFDMGGKLAILLNGVAAKFSKPLYELQGLERVAAAEMMGMSVEQFDELQRISGRLEGNFRQTEKQAKELKRSGEELTQAEIEEQIRTQGIFAKDGKVWTGVLDKQGRVLEESVRQVDDVGDYIQTQGAVLEAAVATEMDEQTRLSVQIAAATTAMSHTMSAGVASTLEGIYSVITSIKEWLFGSDREAEKNIVQAIDIAVQKLDTQISEGKDAIRMSEAMVGSYQNLIRTDPKNKAKHEERLKGEQAALAGMRSHVGGMQAQRRGIRSRAFMEGIPVEDRETFATDFLGAKGNDPKQVADALLSMATSSEQVSKELGSLVEQRAKEGDSSAQLAQAQKETSGVGWSGNASEAAWGLGLSMPAATLHTGLPEFDLPRVTSSAFIEGRTTEQVGTENFVEALKPLDGVELSLAEQLRIEKERDSRASVRRGEQRDDTEDATYDAVKLVMEGIEGKKKREQASAMAQAFKMITGGGSMGLWTDRAEGIMEGKMDEDTRKILNKHRDKVGSLMGNVPNLMGQLGPKTDDMVLQIGAGGVKFAQRVDNNDVGVFAKPGGALSKGGAGGSVNVFHLYNDGPGVLKSIEKAQRAGVLG
jgi:hypothetical protein